MEIELVELLGVLQQVSGGITHDWRCLNESAGTRRLFQVFVSRAGIPIFVSSLIIRLRVDIYFFGVSILPVYLSIAEKLRLSR